ncbi:MAG: DNA internalization-related competence protein ComEC/Rec2 [Actinobacteria bacterium]|nr:DNA internalization-related competence protein ComEC/Rec2 [Actinomycetota bacterium]
MRGPAYILFLLLFAAGITAGRFCNNVCLIILLSVAASVSLIALFTLRGRSRFIKILSAFVVVGMITMFLTGAAAKNGVLPRLARDRAVADVTGRVFSPPVKNGGSLSFFFAVSEVRSSGSVWKTGERLLVRLYDWKEKEKHIFPGSCLSLQGRMEVAGRSSGWLLDHGAASILEASGKNVNRGRDPPDPVSKTMNWTRVWVSGVYERMFPLNVAGFIEGVTLSKTDDMDPGTLADLRGCGLSHVVAVSGLHVGSAAILALALLAAFGAGKKARYLGAIAMAAVVLGLSNFRPSATRAALMAGVCFSGSILGRNYDSLVGLSLAGFLILVMNPRAITDPGFQYSFAAALGIVIAARARRKETGRLRTILTVCAGAQLGILPLVLMSGEGVPVTAIAANLIVVPLVGPLLFTSWAAALLSTLNSHLGTMAAFVPAGIARFTMGLASALSRVPRAGLAGGTVAVASLLVYAVGLVTLIVRARSGRPLFRPVVSLLLAVSILIVPCAAFPGFGAPDKIVVLDVGQGDAILIQDRSGGTVLIDGGPDEKKIIRKLEARGIRHIDLVVLSHPHEDHASGLVEVLREVPVGRLVDPGLARDASGAYRELLDAAEEKRIPRTIAREGQVFAVSEHIRLEVLYAPGDLPEIPENLNNCSVVIMVDLVGTKALMTGDIEADAQKALREMHPGLSCNVLKIPHQGAVDASEPEFIDSCTPTLALISVGRENEYGHPSNRCLDILRARGIGVLRTDRDGDIEVSVGNGRIGVTTESGVKATAAETAR